MSDVNPTVIAIGFSANSIASLFGDSKIVELESFKELPKGKNLLLWRWTQKSQDEFVNFVRDQQSELVCWIDTSDEQPKDRSFLENVASSLACSQSELLDKLRVEPPVAALLQRLPQPDIGQSANTASAYQDSTAPIEVLAKQITMNRLSSATYAPVAGITGQLWDRYRYESHIAKLILLTSTNDIAEKKLLSATDSLFLVLYTQFIVRNRYLESNTLVEIQSIPTIERRFSDVQLEITMPEIFSLLYVIADILPTIAPVSCDVPNTGKIEFKFQVEQRSKIVEFLDSNDLATKDVWEQSKVALLQEYVKCHRDSYEEKSLLLLSQQLSLIKRLIRENNVSIAKTENGSLTISLHILSKNTTGILQTVG